MYVDLGKETHCSNCKYNYYYISAHALTCFNCYNISNPSTCETTMTCQNDEVFTHTLTIKDQ